MDRRSAGRAESEKLGERGGDNTPGGRAAECLGWCLGDSGVHLLNSQGNSSAESCAAAGVGSEQVLTINLYSEYFKSREVGVVVINI